jgi:LPPG:FO 2-phospho-L-lactate transferase
VITVLTGGSGGAKFVQGLAAILPAAELTCIVNTGDDLTWWGLHVSPDLDSITYALAGCLSRERGWGLEGESFHCLEAMRQMGAPSWFHLGDKDLATHLRRSGLLRDGKSLTATTRAIASAMGVEARILPMSDDRVETRVETELGDLAFQEYFVRERHAVRAYSVRFEGASQAEPGPEVVAAIEQAAAVLLAPSNPITSIGPILAVPGIREALARTPATVAAVSPIVGGAAVTGPAGELMATRKLPCAVESIAQLYTDFLDVLIFDLRDAASRAAVEKTGVAALCVNTLMRTSEDKAVLARASLDAVRSGVRA